MAANLAEPVVGQMLDVLIMRLFGPTVKIPIKTLIGVSIIRLGVLQFPGNYLVFIDPDDSIFNPGAEAFLPFLGIIGTHTCLVAVVPPVEPTD
jgi:hypothetical protein